MQSFLCLMHEFGDQQNGLLLIDVDAFQRTGLRRGYWSVNSDLEKLRESADCSPIRRPSPPRDRPRVHQAIRRDDVVPPRPGRVVPRGVKRTMSNDPLRP